MGLEVGTGLLIGSFLAGTASSVVSAKMQSGASKKATAAGERAASDALEFEKRRDELDREEARRIEEQNQRNWATEQARDEYRYGLERGDTLRNEGREVTRYNARQTALQPFRDAGNAALDDLAMRAGLTIRPTAAPQLDMPPSSSPPFPGTPAPKMGDMGRRKV